MTPGVAMLKKDKIIAVLLVLIFVSCTNEKKENKLKEVSLSLVGEGEYFKIYKNLSDSVNLWALNKVGIYSSDTANYDFQIDSLLCFNSNITRFISCLLLRIKDSPSDGLRFFYGEKINNKWYFFTGASIVIPRRMVPNHDVKIPLSYAELHEIALQEVYSPYLMENGEINENWFIQHFEGPGWGLFEHQESMDWLLKGKRFSNKKEFFENVRLLTAAGAWANRDTTQPIKRLVKSQLP